MTMKLKLELRLLLFVLIALALTILPLPAVFSGVRPAWVLLVILYAQFFLPNYFSVWAVVLLGFFMDTLQATLLGEHVFSFVLTTWLASNLTRRFSMFLLPQQIAWITMLCFIYRFTLYLINRYQTLNDTLLMVLGTTILSLMIWPWLLVIFNHSFRPRKQKLEQIYTY